MIVTVLDTETNGLPVVYNAPAAELINWPRVIQLAYQTFDDQAPDVILDEFYELIEPDGWEIPKEKFWIDNGYSTAGNFIDGVPMRSALERLAKTLQRTDRIVAHNISFDFPVIKAEFIRYEIAVHAHVNAYCTKLKSTGICRLRNKAGGYKWPKLEEAYRFFFGENFSGAHDAKADVLACKRVYLHLISL